MISYAEALSRAKANRTDWNERERIAKAIITWVDSEYEEDYEAWAEFEWECQNDR